MSATKRTSPYEYLRKECYQFIVKIVAPKRVGAFWIAKEKLDEAWTMGDVYQRTVAAQALGYEMQLIADDSGLRFQYVTARPKFDDMPWNLRK